MSNRQQVVRSINLMGSVRARPKITSFRKSLTFNQSTRFISTLSILKHKLYQPVVSLPVSRIKRHWTCFGVEYMSFWFSFLETNISTLYFHFSAELVGGWKEFRGMAKLATKGMENSNQVIAKHALKCHYSFALGLFTVAATSFSYGVQNK